MEKEINFCRPLKKKIVTDDEIWVFYYNSVPSEVLPPQSFPTHNLMFCNWYNKLHGPKSLEKTNQLGCQEIPAFYGTKGFITGTQQEPIINVYPEPDESNPLLLV